jgi:hypothetical protein
MVPFSQHHGRPQLHSPSEGRFLTFSVLSFVSFHLFSTSFGWSLFSFYFPSIVEMFSKSFIAPLFLLALTSSVNAHAGVTPALGVKGTLTRNDVQRPSTANPCGKVNIDQTLDSSTAIPANANGSFSAAAINFNPYVYCNCY